ncbi:MAG: ATP-binding protein [Thermoproteota archaeon]|nr:ATP-binding protein [Candidatus Brockarchaeota archaeon]
MKIQVKLISLTRFRKIVYERVEVTELGKRVERPPTKHIRTFEVLGAKVILGRDTFKISGRLISEARLRSADHSDTSSELRMLRGLFMNGFDGMFTVSYEPFNYEMRLSTASRSIEELGKMFSRMRASVHAGFPEAELETLNASSEVVLWPLGGPPVLRYKNALILQRRQGFSAASFLSMKPDDSLDIVEDALENALRSSAESGCSLRFCVPIKSCKGILHALSLWTERRRISSRYSRTYERLMKKGLHNSRGELIGYNLRESAELEEFRLKYERLDSNAGCWTCSLIIVVIGPSEKDLNQAYLRQRNNVEAVKAAFSSSYGIKLEEVGLLSLGSVARSILERKIVDFKKAHMTSDKLSLLVNIPRPITPSISYTPRRNVDFGAFDPAELKGNGIMLGYYESMGRRLEVRIGIEDLPLHLAIFGVPGSGKSTLAKALLRRYRELGGPIMVFDRHGEYINEFDDAMVLNTDNARINLMDHHGDPEGHAKILSEVFTMAWPNEFGPLVSHIFRRMYFRYIREDSCPNLVDFLEFLEKSLDSEDLMLLRSGKARDKLFSLVGRLSELTQGNIGKVFDVVSKQEDTMERLLSDTVIFDLSDMDTDRDANIFAWIMLKQVYDFRKRRKLSKGLPHVIVCEEVHNIAPAKFEGQETIVEKMLKEMRKFKESVWLIDQRPLTVSRDVLGLCGTIICLRLQYSSDVERIADTMHLNEEQRLKLQEFKQGEAIALLPGISTAIPVILQA